MFEKFLERSGNSIKLEEFSEDYIRQYNNLVSEKLISFWRIAGIGIYCNGLFRTIIPNDYQYIIEECYPMYDYETVTPFMITVFGDIFAYVKNPVIGNYVVFINVRYGTFKILSENVDILLNVVIFNKSCLESWFSLNKYPMIKSEKGVPALDECYGYVPALASGGIESIDSIKILKAIPYIEMSLQFIGDLKRVR